MMGLFDGRTVMVTGAGSGIGRAATILFAKQGASLGITDLNEEQLQETAALVKKEGAKVVRVAGDITDVSTIQSTISAITGAFGRLDCAFNNAGITHPEDPLWDDEPFEKTLAINLCSVMRCIKHQAPEMLKQGKGAIVNTASITGLVASENPNQPGYVSSKHAVIGLTKTAALRWGREGIRVNAILPGVTLTPMVEDVMSISPEVKTRLENLCPLGRMATPEEIAEGAIWLCSEKSSFVNGHALVMDGGVTISS